MNTASYKTHTTSRGFIYAYYRSASHGQWSKPTLVFLHGFPSTSKSWRHQVAFFEARGYDVIAPDMLGYGGTDKPTDTESYGSTGLARDIIDILDKEKVGLEGNRAIAVGHDWGSRVVSRIANLYPERFIGFGFLALGYQPPAPTTTFEDTTKEVEKALGRDTLGYQLWLSEEGTAKIIKKNFDSFLSLIFPLKPEFWINHMGPRGAMQEWVESGKVEGIADYITEEDLKYTKEALLVGGLEAPLLWYRWTTSELHMEEDKVVPKSAYTINVPVFFGATQKDFICVPSLYLPDLQEYAKRGLTVKNFPESDHWLPINKSRDDLNNGLLEWIENIEG